MLNNKNINYNDIQEIVNIKASINLGLSEELKLAFPNSVPVIKPDILLNNYAPSAAASSTKQTEQMLIIKEPLWVAGGFAATGESNFFIALQNSKTKSGTASGTVYLRYSISQHSPKGEIFIYWIILLNFLVVDMLLWQAFNLWIYCYKDWSYSRICYPLFAPEAEQSRKKSYSRLKVF